jgi:predicted ATPase
LNLAGETNYPVPPLSLPNPKGAAPPIALVQYEAVRFFIERATTVQPEFRVTIQNAPAVAQICTHLDGIRFPSSAPRPGQDSFRLIKFQPGWAITSTC